MNNNLQLVLKSSTTEMSLNDHDAGIYIVPELDGLTGLPEIRTTSGVNAGYDGGWTSAQKFDARSIVIRGVIANEDKTEVERMRRELVALLAQGKNEQLELDFVTETGRAYEVQVRTIACDMAMQRVLTQQEFMITLRADDPLIYDNSSAGEEATVNVSGATGGFRIPFEIPLAIDAGSEETVVQNSGLESVAPTIKMYGALHNPKIINHTTNQAMQVEAELGFTEGAWTTPVDAPEGTNVSFEPEREAPIESAKLKGDTYQKTYSGKNLLPLEGSTSEKGLTISRNTATGALEFGGTTTGTWPWLNNSDVSLPAGTYTFSIDHALPYNLTLRLYETSSSYPKSVSIPAGSTSGTSTTTYPIVYLAMLYGVTSTGVQVPTTTIYPMLESGSTATSFEPYVGGIPAPNPDYPQAVQTVTGEQTIKIQGRNLYPLIASTTSHDIVYTQNADGTYNISGTSSAAANAVVWVDNISEFVDGGTYTLSVSPAPTGIQILVEAYNNTTWQRALFVGSASATTITSAINLANTNRIKFSLRVPNANTTVSLQNLKVQLEKGSSASSFEPYKEQSYKVNLGKNLFDKDNVVVGKVLNGDGSYQDSTGWSTSDFIRVSPNTAYYKTATSSARFKFYDSGKAPLSSVYDDIPSPGDAQSFTTPSECFYIRFSFRDTFADSIQLEAGTAGTTYAAYFEPIELRKIGTYQDYIYKDGTDWKIHKAVGETELSSSWSWYYNSSSHGFSASFVAGRNWGVYAGYCSHATVQGSSSTWTGVGKCGWNASNTFWFEDGGMIATSAADFKTWLDSNIVDVYYALNTPTDTVITNSALIEQLEALVDGNAVVYGEKTNIAVGAAEGNMRGIAAIRYYTDKEPDQRDELVIDSRLKTITLNGLDVYHLQAPGSEFLMLAPGENKLSLQSDITGDNGYAKVSYKQGYLSI